MEFALLHPRFFTRASSSRTELTSKRRHPKYNKTEQVVKHEIIASVQLPIPRQSKPKAVGLLVTGELEKALDQCRTTVNRISKDCRAKNRKFRDFEFDLDNDKTSCLYGLVPGDEHRTTGAARVTEIFQKPQFFIDGAGSNDVVQGQLGNCWFLSALTTISAADNRLIEKICVARDEQVGVYGFVFFKNGSWVTLIIDDLLYINIPKFEELTFAEQLLFHSDKRKYNGTARKGGNGLYFARPATENETWVPLIEKAYAKLHGDYSSLSGGRAAEAVEDLTGGVSSMIRAKDILDIDKFWEEELLKANSDRLFAAAYGELDTERSGKMVIQVEGLFGGHAYSVLKAVEVNGKRFVVLRNPWGTSEWNGPWSDGAKEWTPEWLARLPEIGHLFGDDGQFVMEYSDFLEQFEQIDKTLLFDETWKMSMEWLRVPIRPPPSAWSFGDVSFNFSVTELTNAVIVLSRLDERYFRGVEGPYIYSLQFLLYKIGETENELISESEQPVFGSRSVNTEASLAPGKYAVHVRLEGLLEETEPTDTDEVNKRKLARVLTERAQARLIASNHDPLAEKSNFPIPIGVLVDRERLLAEARAKGISGSASSGPIVSDESGDAMPEAQNVGDVEDGEDDDDSRVDHDEEAAEEKKKKKKKHKGKKNNLKRQNRQKRKDEANAVERKHSDSEEKEESEGGDSVDSDNVPSTDGNSENSGSGGIGLNSDSDEPVAFIGLRVYTQGKERINIIGTIKEEAERLYVSALLETRLAPEGSKENKEEGGKETG